MHHSLNVGSDFSISSSPCGTVFHDTSNFGGKSDASCAVNASGHLSVDERSKVFILDRSFIFVVSSNFISIDNRNVLKIALSSLFFQVIHNELPDRKLDNPEGGLLGEIP